MRTRGAPRHILVATDGSALSRRAVRLAARLAKVCGAKLTGLHVVAPYFEPARGAALAALPGYRRAIARAAEAGLRDFARIARAAGVRAEARAVTGGEPWKDILRTARARRCDLIVMASHGRRGIAGVLLGSETQKVLVHSRLPVLVCR
ncbi:MAG: universal stress protein [Burkholderiales bacterium]|nr:universal stress protein [Burkholderiales bacterium]